jgi:hypothetical protein
MRATNFRLACTADKNEFCHPLLAIPMSQSCEESVKRDLQIEDESEQSLLKKQKLDESIDTIASEGAVEDVQEGITAEVVTEVLEVTETVEDVPQQVHVEEAIVVAETVAEQEQVALAACSAEVTESCQSAIAGTEECVEPCADATESEANTA